MVSLGPNDLGSGSGAIGGEAARHDAWSRYWASGALHSCVGSFGEDYGGAIAEFWRGVFRRLPESTRVLDIATGNGALPRLLLQECPSDAVMCDAVDIAAISPSWLGEAKPSEQRRVNFHGGVDAAVLPFPAGSFNLVVSQYGIEYTDLSRTLPELLRVLAPDGGVALLVHHQSGRPVQLAGIELAHIEWMLAKDGLFDVAQKLVEPFVMAGTPDGRSRLAQDSKAVAARDRFNALLDELLKRAATVDGSDVLYETRDTLMAHLANASNQGVTKTRATVAELGSEYRASATRLKDLCSKALTNEAIAALRGALEIGLRTNILVANVFEHSHHMGCTLLGFSRVR